MLAIQSGRLDASSPRGFTGLAADALSLPRGPAGPALAAGLPLPALGPELWRMRRYLVMALLLHLGLVLLLGNPPGGTARQGRSV